jgi:DNA-binding SARP family transcriptional activator
MGGTRSPHRLRAWLVPLEGDWYWLRPDRLAHVRRALLARRHGRHRGAPLCAAHSTAVAVEALATEPADGPDAVALSLVHEPGTPMLPPSPHPGACEHSGSVELCAHLLGRFAVSIAGRPMTGVHSNRGIRVLQYLLLSPTRSASRDQLLEQFWPDADPARSRNRLHVAITSLRRALREVADVAVIEHRAGLYRINPELALDVDLDRFDAHRRAGHEAQRRGNAEGAIVSYQAAVALYRGDLLAECPYEEWTIFAREVSRNNRMEMLDQLASLLIDAGRFEECIASCQQLLATDPCHEKAYRLLMRCYATQGNINLAVRQFEVCRQALRTTLAVNPATETVELYRDLRRPGLEPGSRTGTG